MGGRGGGILVYARKEINCWQDEEENGFNQSISVRVEVEKGIELAVHVIYRSPNSTKQNDEELCKWIKKVKGKCLIIGDINYPGIRCDEGRSDARGREFYQACCNTFLEQLVKEATHRSGIILDLVLTNQGEKVREVKMDGRLDKSNHQIIIVSLHCDMESRKTSHRFRNFKKADYREARTMIAAVEWREELEQMDVETAWQKIKCVLT